MLKKARIKLTQLNFKTKIIIAFVFTVFITLLITDVTIFIVMDSNINSSLNVVQNTTEHFQLISTNHVSQASVYNIMIVGNNIKLIIQNLYASYIYFSKNKSFFADLETPYRNVPPKTQSFTQTKMIPGIYFYQQNSTFHADPFLDQILLRSFPQNVVQFKRVSVFYWNQSNPSDMMARTFPATSDFIIRDPMIVVNRSKNVQEGMIKRSQVEFDQYTKNVANAKPLVCQRIVITPQDKPGFKIMFQQQNIDGKFKMATKSMYYESSANAVILRIDENSKTNKVYGGTTQVDFEFRLFENPGFHRITLQNGTILLANTVGFNGGRPIGSSDCFNYQNSSQFKFILMTNQQKVNLGVQKMKSFLSKIHLNITVSLIAISIVVMLLVFSLSYNIGTLVQNYFNSIKQSIKNFIQKPQDKKKTIQKLRYINAAGNLKQFQGRLIKVMQRIDLMKEKLSKTKDYKYNFSLNQKERQFQKKYNTKNIKIIDQALQKIQKIQFEAKKNI